MKSKICFFIPFIVFIVMSCVSEPSLGSSDTLSFPSGTNTILPRNAQTPTQTIVPNPTIHPQVQQRLIGADAFLPPGGQPLYEQAWTSSARDGSWGGVYLPYRVQGGSSLLVLGQQRQEDNSWNVENQILIWDWQNSRLDPIHWQEIRPVGRGQNSFLGLDQDGHWWAVMGEINWEVPEYVLLGIFPVSVLDDIPVDGIGRYPTEELDDLQIERIGLYPPEERPAGVAHFLFRDKNNMILFQMENGQTREIWSTDWVIQGRFHVHSYAESGGSIDMTGDGLNEVLIVWDLNFPPLIDVYQIVVGESDILRWAGRVDSTWQYTDITADGVPEFLQPNDPEAAQEWEVIGWDGSPFAQLGTISPPQLISPPPVMLDDPKSLPLLPSNLIFRGQDYYRWWRWSRSGGIPEELLEPPNLPDESCFLTYSDACFSPAGRFKMISITPHIEGAYAGIFDGVTGKQVLLPDSFVYTEGYNTFAWSPDEAFLLFGRGDGIARLTKVNPVSGESQTVWNSSLCGLDVWDCTRYGGFLAITDPVVFEDGSFGFAFQSAFPALYPPPGIYRLSPQGKLIMLAALPFIDESKGSSNNPSSSQMYGRLVWSPDKSTFIYYDLFVGNKIGVRTLLLGKADGSALWDLREALPGAREFRWENYAN